MTEGQKAQKASPDGTDQSALEIPGVVAAVTTQICLATMILIATFLMMQIIVESGRQLQSWNLVGTLLGSIVFAIPFFTNIAAAQRTRHSPLLGPMLMFLTSLGCGWHLLFFGSFMMQSLTKGVMHMHGLAAAFEFMVLFAHFIITSAFILFAMIADRRVNASLFVIELDEDVLTSRPKRAGALYAGTIALLCLCAAVASKRFLKPELSALFKEPYSISSLSSDSKILAVGSAFRNDHTRREGSMLMLLQAATLKLIVPAIQLPQCVRQLEFVSTQFGFLAVLMDDKHSEMSKKNSTVTPELVQIRPDGTIRIIESVLPQKICCLQVSPNGEVAGIGALDEVSHEANFRFVRLADGVEIASFELTDFPSFRMQFLDDNTQVLLLAHKPAWKWSNGGTCSLLNTKEGSIQRLFEINDAGQSQTSTVIDPSSHIFEFISEGKLVQVWFSAERWHYVIAGRVPGSYGPFGLTRLAADRIVTSDSYSGSHNGTTVTFFQGRPPQLLDHRIESDGHFSDMELTTDGTRLLLIDRFRVSVYRFPGS